MKNTVATCKVIYLLLIEFPSLQLTFAEGNTCGTIGNRNETAVTPSRAQLFYLNTANPAPCTGNITRWRVCYYTPERIDSFGTYWATYAVYRKIGSDNDTRYERVSEIFRAVRSLLGFSSESADKVDGALNLEGFDCYRDSIDSETSPLTIQAGDVLGACVFDPEGDVPVLRERLQLDVVGEVSGKSLLQMGTAGCSMETIPSDIPANQLSTLASRTLHIYANIKKLTTSSLESNASATMIMQDAIPSTEVREAIHTRTQAQTTKTITTIMMSPAISTASVSTRDYQAIVEIQVNHTAGIVAIAAGSAGCGLILLLTLVAVIVTITACYLLRKHKHRACIQRNEMVGPSESDVVLTGRIDTYLTHPSSEAIELSSVKFSMEVEHTRYTQQERSVNTDEVPMSQNVAYESSTTIPTTSNVAYVASKFEEESGDYENYDYPRTYPGVDLAD